MKRLIPLLTMMLLLNLNIFTFANEGDQDSSSKIKVIELENGDSYETKDGKITISDVSLKTDEIMNVLHYKLTFEVKEDIIISGLIFTENLIPDDINKYDVPKEEYTNDVNDKINGLQYTGKKFNRTIYYKKEINLDKVEIIVPVINAKFLLSLENIEVENIED